MQIDRAFDPTTQVGLVCRQGRLSGSLAALVMSSLFIGAPLFAWYMGAAWLLWSFLALFALAIVPLLLGDLRDRFRATNWLLCMGRDALWINLRSYQDRSDAASSSAVRLEYSEIARACQHVNQWSEAGYDSTTYWTLKSLDLSLRHSNTAELSAAVSAHRNREQPLNRYLGFITVRRGISHYSVLLPAPDVIRLAWHGGQHHWVTPSLRRVLNELADQSVTVVEPTQHNVPPGPQLPECEVDERILELVRLGDRLEAIKLLVDRRGYSLSEAKRFVDELNSRV